MEELKRKKEFYRLSDHEYQLICQKLGRPPQGVEWALFSALWSEHCSYKSSRIHLKKLNIPSKRVLESFGENAGVVDLEHGERIAFKIESHNHPSFIEPKQGAATGVGGILRDVFTMGARPIASANYLCFGDPQAPRMSVLVDGVVKGIGGYGNCVGVPTVTGQTEFHSSYNNNILVNAMSVGLFRPGERVFLSKAKGDGNYLVYVGAKTGRDGVHGASMASESFNENSEQKRPNVQIGDPFFEKLLIESCLEAMQAQLVVAIQDMGAAGLTSSSFEMASKGEVGLKIQLDQVPLRDSSITPEEILLSESQERMLLICEPEKFDKLEAIFHKWDLDARIIGEVTSKKTVELYWQNKLLTSLNPSLLVDEAPLYERPYDPWVLKNRVSKKNELDLKINDVSKELIFLLSSSMGCSRKWIYQQYDQRVGIRTVCGSEYDIAVLRLPDSGRALGIAMGCRPYLMRMDAFVGAVDAIYQPALELAVKGFEPLAITDCLNFGNPEKKSVMSEFVATIDAMKSICQTLNLPIVSGNVSFYNETLGTNITSTPATGLIGLRNDVFKIPSDEFVEASDHLILVRCPQIVVQGAFQDIKNIPSKGIGEFNNSQLSHFLTHLLEIMPHFTIKSSKVVGKFGLCYQLSRMCKKMGAKIETSSLKTIGVLNESDLFKETLYEVIIAVHHDLSEKILRAFDQKAIEAHYLGVTGGDRLILGEYLNVEIQELINSYETGWRINFNELE